MATPGPARMQRVGASRSRQLHGFAMRWEGELRLNPVHIHFLHQKKKGASESGGGGTEAPDSSISNKKDDKAAPPAPGDEKPCGPKAPADQAAVAGTHDPNYQTLAGVDGKCFEDKKGASPAAPAAAAPKPGGPGMAGEA